MLMETLALEMFPGAQCDNVIRWGTHCPYAMTSLTSHCTSDAGPKTASKQHPQEDIQLDGTLLGSLLSYERHAQQYIRPYLNPTSCHKKHQTKS